MKTPHECTLEELRPYVSEWLSRTRKGGNARPKTFRPCPKCTQLFGARELRLHLPQCQPHPID